MNLVCFLIQNKFSFHRYQQRFLKDIFIIYWFYSVCESITGNKIALFICFILVGGISVGSIISGGYGSSFALKNPKFSFDQDENDFKCSKYFIEGSAGALAWATKQGLKKLNEYRKWAQDLAEDVYNKEGDYTGYLCRDVGAPTMTFVLVQCCAIILWVVILLLSLIC